MENPIEMKHPYIYIYTVYSYISIYMYTSNIIQSKTTKKKSLGVDIQQ